MAVGIETFAYGALGRGRRERWSCGHVDSTSFARLTTGDDVHELTRIDFVPASSESNSRIEIYWAGWADLICNHYFSTELTLETRSAETILLAVEQKIYASVDSRLRKLEKRLYRG